MLQKGWRIGSEIPFALINKRRRLMKANRNWRMAIVILLTSSVIVLSLLLLRAKDPMTAKANEIQSVPYKLLHDDNGDSINIGVPENANEEQLRATLVK